MTEKFDDMWDELLSLGVSEETIRTVCQINGWSEDSMHDILYAQFGERIFRCEEEENE